MMNKQLSLLFILCLTLAQINATNTDNRVALGFNERIEVQLDSSTPKEYQILAGEGQSNTEDLYIHASPKFADPFEVPYLTITAEGDYEQHCYNANAQFAGVCRVKAKDLVSHPKFLLTVKCLTNCSLNIETYLSKVVKLDVGSSIQLTAHEESGLTEIVEVEVPDVDFTSLAVMAVILNLEENIEIGEEGVDVLINYGNKGVADPTQQKFQVRTTSLNGGGKGAFIYHDKLKAKQVIKSYIKLKKGIHIRFSIVSLKGNEFSIELGKPYYDYALKNETKIYTLDAASFLPESSDKTVEIVFDIYSGTPQLFVSFSHQFKELVEFTRKSTAVSILISPEIREKYKFKETLYIKVETDVTAEYYFYAQLVRDDATFIQPYLTYFDEIQTDHLQNYFLFERYKYPEGQTQQNRNFSFKVDMIAGKGSFYFKRCQSMESKSQDNPSLENCLIKKSSQLREKSFYDEEIQNKNIVTGNLLTIFMSYDITKCTEVKRNEGFVHVACAFQIIILGQSYDPFEFSFLPERKYLTNYIRQGKLIKEYIPKDKYAYFAFSLPDIDSVDEINIFLTALSGDAALIISTTQKLPGLNATIKQSGSKCNLVLKKDQIASDIYISVYAYQFTEINLGVIVHRKMTPGSVHEIPLESSNTLNYILNNTQSSVVFKINSRDATEITVFLNEISGHVRMTIFDQSKKETKCVNSDTRLFCKFVSETNRNYSIKVQNESSQAKFSITYKTQKNECFSGHLNHPTYVTLPANNTYCYEFSINREIDLELVTSFTHIQILDKQITASLSFNEKLSSKITNPHTSITLSDMNQVCELGLKVEGFPRSCRLSVSFENKAQVSNYFSFILEEIDADIALFDGVNEKVRGTSAESGDGRNFYYHVKNQKSIQIFFSTQSLKSHYFLAAKFVSNDQFLSRNEIGKNIYLNYVPVNDRKPQKIEKRNNYYTAVLGMTGLEVVSIEQDSINKYCKDLDCYLLLSVYAEAYENNLAVDEDFYEIEVTQEETALALGESKVGVVNHGDIYTYVVYPQDAIVEFKLLNTEGKRKMCLTVEGALANGTVVKGNELSNDLQVEKKDQIERIFVKGQADACSFEISYISNSNPYRIVRLSQPYELNLEAGKFERFIYYHQNPRTFKIAPMVSAGSPKAYIMPVKSADLNLSALSKISLDEYPIVSSYEGEYTMRQNDPNFCSKCYYYILITTQTKFIGQVIFLRLYDPVPLTTNHIFKEHLLPLTALGVQNYIYYSLTSFNITFNMLSGIMNLAIVDPAGNTVVEEEMTHKKTFSFKSIDYEEQDKIEFYSERAKYKLRVAVVEEAEFYIEVNRQHNSERIFQGYPSKIKLHKEEVQTVEFINSQDLDKPLNLMIDVEEQHKSDVLLTFNLRGQGEKGELLDNDKLLKNITKSDNTYILVLLNFNGRLYVDIKSTMDVNATIVLVKNKLTHISPKQNYLFNTEGVYQVYSNYKKVMIEVFNCQGELDLIGSRDERDMEQAYQGASPIKIKRPNYGGHYVFKVEMMFASYYIRIASKSQGEPLQYLINYYYYEDVNPYDVIDADNYQISFQNKGTGILVSVNPPTITDYRKGAKEDIEIDIKIQKITYTAYVSKNRIDLNRYSRCLITGDVQEKTQDQPSIQLSMELLSKAKGNGEVQKVFATVQASISISVKHPDEVVVRNFPRTLTILYNAVEIPLPKTVRIVEQQSYKYWFTDSFILFIGWMILPFVLASATLYYLLTYCMRRLMMRQSDMVEEVEIVPSNQTVPTEQKIGEAGAGDSGTIPGTGTQMIKQHI